MVYVAKETTGRDIISHTCTVDGDQTQRQKHITLIESHKPHTAAAAALLCHKQSGHIAYRPRSKPAPTDVDLQPNSHTQPWSAV